MKDKKVNMMVYTSLFAALVCVATFMIKVPSVVTNGYTHIGDGFIFIAVILIGKKNGALAGAIGASLADMLGGYFHYALPTFIIKGIMALIMGFVIDKISQEGKTSYIIGAILGSIWQVAAYYVVGSLMVGSFISTIMDIPGNMIQSAVGIITTVVFMTVFKNTPLYKKIGMHII